MSSDVIADMLSKIKNASMVGKDSIEITHSKMREAVAKVLEEAAYVKKVKTFKEKNSPSKSLHIDLSYRDNGKPMIKNIRRISKPGRRYYVPSIEIKKIDPKYGLVVISTPKGVMSGEAARKKKLGGELICEVI